MFVNNKRQFQNDLSDIGFTGAGYNKADAIRIVKIIVVFHRSQFKQAY